MTLLLRSSRLTFSFRCIMTIRTSYEFRLFSIYIYCVYFSFYSLKVSLYWSMWYWVGSLIFELGIGLNLISAFAIFTISFVFLMFFCCRKTCITLILLPFAHLLSYYYEISVFVAVSCLSAFNVTSYIKLKYSFFINLLPSCWFGWLPSTLLTNKWFVFTITLQCSLFFQMYIDEPRRFPRSSSNLASHSSRHVSFICAR